MLLSGHHCNGRDEKGGAIKWTDNQAAGSQHNRAPQLYERVLLSGRLPIKSTCGTEHNREQKMGSCIAEKEPAQLCGAAPTSALGIWGRSQESLHAAAQENPAHMQERSCTMARRGRGIKRGSRGQRRALGQKGGHRVGRTSHQRSIWHPGG